jgi:hypothetical protein
MPFPVDGVAPPARTPAAIFARSPARWTGDGQDHRSGFIQVRPHCLTLSPGAGSRRVFAEGRNRNTKPSVQSAHRPDRTGGYRDPRPSAADGPGKSRLARRIYELKKARRAVKGPFVDVNARLFAAIQECAGLLRTANNGVFAGHSVSS